MKFIDAFAAPHPSGDPEDTGVHAHLASNGIIEILTDCGDSSLSTLTPGQARELARWLDRAADIADENTRNGME